MSYVVKEVFHTLQGEGVHAGRAAVFLRFSGCNLWTGREHRATAICRFCDTDFVGTDGPLGGVYSSPDALAEAVAECWNVATGSVERAHRFVVCTGGEPLLQLDGRLVDALHREGFEIAVETNGTCIAPDGLDWICMSPKAGTEVVLTHGDELKVVFPQPGAEPERFESLDFDHFVISPMDGPNLARNTQLAVEFCRTHPRWRLSTQTHKIIGIP